MVSKKMKNNAPWPRDGGRPLGSVDLQASLVHAEYEFRERSCKTQGRQIAVHPRPRRRSHEDPAMTTSAATESRVEIDGKIFNPYSKDFIRSPLDTWKRRVAAYPVAWHTERRK